MKRKFKDSGRSGILNFLLESYFVLPFRNLLILIRVQVKFQKAHFTFTCRLHFNEVSNQQLHFYSRLHFPS